jgi:peptidoglycan/LPS O-acetylase OafA/YrhL
VQNFVQDYSAYFLPFSWSLAVEEQFYLLLPLYLAFILLKTERPFFHLFILLVISLLIRTFIILNDDILREESIKGIIFDAHNFGHYFVVIYDNLYTRFGAFIGGIAAAYAYRYRQEQSLHFLQSKLASLITIFAMLIALSLCLMPVLMKGFELNQNMNIFLNIARRNIVCLCAAWLLFCGIFAIQGQTLIHNNARRFNQTMSLKIFYPFGHLLYSMYLFHYIAVAFVLGNMHLNFRLFDIDYMQHFGWWMLLAVILSFIGTVIIAIFSYLFIEAPIMKLRPRLKA